MMSWKLTKRWSRIRTRNHKSIPTYYAFDAYLYKNFLLCLIHISLYHTRARFQFSLRWRRHILIFLSIEAYFKFNINWRLQLLYVCSMALITLSLAKTVNFKTSSFGNFRKIFCHNSSDIEQFLPPSEILLFS